MEGRHFYIDSRQVTPAIEDPITKEITPVVDYDLEDNTSYISKSVYVKLNSIERVADAWYQAGFVLITAANDVFALGYSGIIMVPLGWIGGTAGLIAATLISFYANHLLARLHETGGKRHIRYRDLAGHIYGKGMYYVTWTLQYINLFMINIGFIILAGRALKAIYTMYNMYNNESPLKLPYCTSMAGLACFIFAFSIPHLSALRFWLAVSTLLSLIYIMVSIVLSIKDGYDSPKRDYGIPGSITNQVFNSIGTIASLFFACNTGMLPEIQATVRHPYVKNIQKALFLQFTAGIVPYFTLTLVGYWAYGSSTSSYLLNNVHGPKWVKTLANAAAFLQTVITLHIFASPAYECLDTKFGRKHESIYSVRNSAVRFVGRGTYLGLSTFVAALLPFSEGFMNLTGAVSLIPLTFVLANHMYIKVKGSDLTALQRSWHWANIWVFAFVAAGAAVSAFHQIVVDSQKYHVFADL